jgi:hypothetical protein
MAAVLTAASDVITKEAGNGPVGGQAYPTTRLGVGRPVEGRSKTGIAHILLATQEPTSR